MDWRKDEGQGLLREHSRGLTKMVRRSQGRPSAPSVMSYVRVRAESSSANMVDYLLLTATQFTAQRFFSLAHTRTCVRASTTTTDFLFFFIFFLL